MWQTARLPFLRVAVWGCQGGEWLCPRDNPLTSFVILDSLNEAVAAFQPFTVTDGAELVQKNCMWLLQASSDSFLDFVHCFFNLDCVSVLAFFPSNKLVLPVIFQFSLLLVRPGCHECPDVTCSLTIASLWSWAEVRFGDRRPLYSHLLTSPN